MQSAAVRFPRIYADSLSLIGEQAHAKEREAYWKLRRNDIRILGKKWDHGEYFLMWQHRGETQIIRMLEGKLPYEVQKKVDELLVKFEEDRQ